MSFNVIYVVIAGKLVSIACYDKQQVYVYWVVMDRRTDRITIAIVRA